MKKTPTPTPWFFEGTSIVSGTTVDRVGKPSLGVASTSARGRCIEQEDVDAEHIVKCVNNHDALVAALSELRAAVHPLPLNHAPLALKRDFYAAYRASGLVLAKVEE